MYDYSEYDHSRSPFSHASSFYPVSHFVLQYMPTVGQILVTHLCSQCYLLSMPPSLRITELSRPT
jgi:hypothetical protein